MQYTLSRTTFPFLQPAGTSRGILLDRTSWFVRLTDGTAWGEGECAPLPGLSKDALEVEEYEALIHAACRQLCSTGEVNREQLRPYPSILFGLETARLSLQASQRGQSPFRLYDTPFTRGEAGIPINGLVWMGDLPTMLRRMEEKLALGFRCIKVKIGALDFESELELLCALRKQYGPDRIQLRVDANGAFHPEEAMEKLQRLAPFHIHSIEQPIRAGQWQEMARLCQTSPIPIALDEELIGINACEDKAQLLATIRPQYLVLKPSLHGGMSGCEEWIRLAREHGIQGWVTSALESNCGLNAIAAWVSHLMDQTQPTATFFEEGAHQGLGTGALYRFNYPGTSLHLEGENLWAAYAPDVAFQQELQEYQAQFKDLRTTAMEVHTSGSTGAPQPLQVGKARMQASARRTCTALGLPHGATALLCMPLRYIAAQMMVVRALEWPLRLWAVQPSSHPLGHLDFAPDFVAMTPMQAFATLQVPREASLLRQVKTLLLGGGAISQELSQLLRDFPGEVWSSYGMTETLSNVALRRLNGPAASEWYAPLPEVGIALANDGTLVITDPVTNDQPLHTHDLAEMRTNEDGRSEFRILGRTDNIICSGGIKLQLEELEQRLASHLPYPFLLTATPDAQLGQALTLVYEGPEADLPKVKTLVRQVLQGPACPRLFRAVSQLPHTETGKPLRR